MEASNNLLLASFSAEDRAAVEPYLKRVWLDPKQVLFAQDGLVEMVHFPVTAVVSMVVMLENGQSVESAMVGKYGAAGISSALDGKVSFNSGVVQIPGEAYSCYSSVLKNAALKSASLLSTLIRHEQVMFAEAQQSTACMAAHGLVERLARWLLRSRDLSGSDTLPLTQEFMAEMLGVQRTSVTIHAGILQSAGMISYTRGKVRLLNLDGLRDASCECYRAIDARHKTLLEGR
jgi:CRP-like cAMP-binding protein